MALYVLYALYALYGRGTTCGSCMGAHTAHTYMHNSIQQNIQRAAHLRCEEVREDLDTL